MKILKGCFLPVLQTQQLYSDTSKFAMLQQMMTLVSLNEDLVSFEQLEMFLCLVLA